MSGQHAELSSPETADRVLRLLQRQSLGGLVAASFDDIGRELAIGRSTADRAVKRLIEDGHLVVARRGTGRLYPTTYNLPGDPS